MDEEHEKYQHSGSDPHPLSPVIPPASHTWRSSPEIQELFHPFKVVWKRNGEWVFDPRYRQDWNHQCLKWYQHHCFSEQVFPKNVNFKWKYSLNLTKAKVNKSEHCFCTATGRKIVKKQISTPTCLVSKGTSLAWAVQARPLFHRQSLRPFGFYLFSITIKELY